jgi:hypothetical protein
MKSLFLTALLFSGIAAAQTTVTLQPEDCTATNICFSVPNDAGVTIDYISDAIQYRLLVVEVNGVQYDSGLWTLNGQMNQSNVTLYAPDGSSLVASVVFTVTTGKCVRSGRATVCPRHVTLTGGTLVLP